MTFSIHFQVTILADKENNFLLLHALTTGVIEKTTVIILAA